MSRVKCRQQSEQERKKINPKLTEMSLLEPS